MIESPEPPARRAVAVVGGGIIGLCLAEALAEQGISLWCFEEGTVGSGQSGGVTRIFRHRHERSRLVKLALRARSSWISLGERLGERLIGDEGVLILTAEDEAPRLEQLGVSVEDLSWQDASERMPIGEASHGRSHAVFERHGGAIRARHAIEALNRTASHSMVNAKVHGIEQNGSVATIFASNGIYEVDEVFVAAGAGTAQLAKAGGFAIPERRACHLRLTFESRIASTLPCLLDKSKEFGEVAYGSPTPDGRGYAIGISSEDGAVQTSNSEAPDAASLHKIESRIEAYAERLLPTVLGPVTGARLCLTTPLQSGDDDFYAWRRDRITYLAGHNLFKFAPLIGALLAESTLGNGLPQELKLTPPE
ncbi:MAG TPA: FAD-binding oxidoreductase [Solirubrobacterales bacterium]